MGMIDPENVVVPKDAGREVGKIYIEVLGLSRVKEMMSKLEGFLDAARDLIEQMEDVELGIAACSERPGKAPAAVDETVGKGGFDIGHFDWRRPDEPFDRKFARALREVADWFEQGVVDDSLVYTEVGAPVVTVELDPDGIEPKVGVSYEAFSLSRFARLGAHPGKNGSKA